MSAANPVDPRVTGLLAELKLNHEVGDDGDVRVGFETEGGRKQIIVVSSQTSQFGAMEIRELFSPAVFFDGFLDVELANAVLVINAEMKMGSWRILRGSGRVQSALTFGVQIDAGASAASLLTSLHLVCAATDEMEKQLTR